jgi:phosphate transport system substrate-binding protein
MRFFVAAAVLPFLFAWTATRAPAYGETLKVGGTGGALGAMKVLAEAFRKIHPDVKIVMLPSMGSTGAVKAVLAGAIDIGVASRQLDVAEEREGAVQYRYAVTPFVFAVGMKTSAPDYISGQLSGIYAGTITAWPDGKPIRLVLRPKGDSDTLTLRRMSDDMGKALDMAFSRKGMSIAMTDQDSADMIEKVPGALGTTTLAQILTEKRAIKPLALNGVTPTPDALRDGSYPHYKTLYLVTKGDASGPSRRFVDFALSAGARPILLKSGHVVPERKSGN